MKKYKLTQRFPNFFSGFTPEVAEFDSLEDLYQISFVKRWLNNPDFIKFSHSDDGDHYKNERHFLMANLKDKSFWAIGILTCNTSVKINDLGLPVHIIPLKSGDIEKYQQFLIECKQQLSDTENSISCNCKCHLTLPLCKCSQKCCKRMDYSIEYLQDTVIPMIKKQIERYKDKLGIV